MSIVYYEEEGYINLMKDVLANGVKTPDRTGVGCYKVFDRKLVWNVGKQFPFSTFRSNPLSMAFKEFWFFMKGYTDTNILYDQGVKFWAGNTSREFLDGRGLEHLKEGDMGKAYGYQWRNFSGEFDQLMDISEKLVNDPYSRRMLTTFWNPAQSKEMALTPCWHSHQFVCIPEKDGSLTLNMKVMNRSLDVVFGESFARQQYALYLICMAKLANMNVGYMSCDLTDIHIYENQLEFAKEAVERDLGTPGTITIDKDIKTIDDIINLEWEDIKVEGLVVNKTPFVNEKPPMAV